MASNLKCVEFEEGGGVGAQKQIRTMVGNRDTTLMWEDLWIGDMALKSKFARLYSVSVQKQMMISDCGLLDGLIWVWSLFWRRELYDWEKELVN